MTGVYISFQPIPMALRLLSRVLASGAVMAALLPAAHAQTLDAAAQASVDANTKFAMNLINTFSRGEVRDFDASDDDDAALQFSGIDMRGYMNHDCFVITGERERELCVRMFGPFADLRAVLLNGMFAQMVAAVGLSGEVERAALQVAGVEALNIVEAEEAIDMEAELRRDRAWRSGEVWRLCGEMDMNDDASIRSCFQRNARLIDRFDVEVNGNVY